jgi:cytidylate kinase
MLGSKGQVITGETMTKNDSLGRFLEAQLVLWSRDNAEKKSLRVGPIIAISREPGCGGEDIARRIANELGLALYDWEVVHQIAVDARVSEKVVATLDEDHRSELEEWLADLAGGTGLSEARYLESLRRVLFTIAAHGDAVIVGRGANFVLPPERRTLGVCLVAPLDVRVKNIMQQLNLSENEARKHIASKEKEHRQLLRRLGKKEIMDATNYHLVVNTALLSPDTIVQVVKGILGRKPRQAKPAAALRSPDDGRQSQR